MRASLRRKGLTPDVLVMTATPIPRTLAMTLYGDLDFSVIDEMPPDRRPVRTTVMGEGRREQAYDTIRKEVKKGHQAYIVYPLIEASESLDLGAAVAMARGSCSTTSFQSYASASCMAASRARRKTPLCKPLCRVL